MFFFGEPEDDEPPPLEEVGAYTLDDEWDEQWFRIFNRSELPDRDGPMLQRFDESLYRRHTLDITVPEFPMTTEPLWAGRKHGIRLWVQSQSELTLANRLQIRTEFETWEDGFIRIRYDRRQDRLTDRHVLRFDVGHSNIADSGIDLALRFHPKWDKDDIDIEFLADYDIENIGSAGLRVAALDAFMNASYSILEARDRFVEEDVRHTDIPLAVAAQFKTETFLRLRGEAYGGMVLPNTRRHRFVEEPERDHLRYRQAVLGAALIEWDVPIISMRTGIAFQSVNAQNEWEFVESSENDRIVNERTISRRVYAISQPFETLRVETSLLRTARPQEEQRPGLDEQTERSDREWLLSLRAFWMPTDVVGADFAILRLTRSTDGPPDLGIDGEFSRFTTRLMLRFSPDLWTSFGIGWTFDEGTSFFDGGGMSLIYIPSKFF